MREGGHFSLFISTPVTIGLPCSYAHQLKDSSFKCQVKENFPAWINSASKSKNAVMKDIAIDRRYLNAKKCAILNVTRSQFFLP